MSLFKAFLREFDIVLNCSTISGNIIKITVVTNAQQY